MITFEENFPEFGLRPHIRVRMTHLLTFALEVHITQTAFVGKSGVCWSLLQQDHMLFSMMQFFLSVYSNNFSTKEVAVFFENTFSALIP